MKITDIEKVKEAIVENKPAPLLSAAIDPSPIVNMEVYRNGDVYTNIATDEQFKLIDGKWYKIANEEPKYPLDVTNKLVTWEGNRYKIVDLFPVNLETNIAKCDKETPMPNLIQNNGLQFLIIDSEYGVLAKITKTGAVTKKHSNQLFTRNHDSNLGYKYGDIADIKGQDFIALDTTVGKAIWVPTVPSLNNELLLKNKFINRGDLFHYSATNSIFRCTDITKGRIVLSPAKGIFDTTFKMIASKPDEKTDITLGFYPLDKVADVSSQYKYIAFSTIESSAIWAKMLSNFDVKEIREYSYVYYPNGKFAYVVAPESGIAYTTDSNEYKNVLGKEFIVKNATLKAGKKYAIKTLDNDIVLKITNTLVPGKRIDISTMDNEKEVKVILDDIEYVLEPREEYIAYSVLDGYQIMKVAAWQTLKKIT